jgi:hypothetical protein
MREDWEREIARDLRLIRWCAIAAGACGTMAGLCSIAAVAIIILAAR